MRTFVPGRMWRFVWNELEDDWGYRTESRVAVNVLDSYGNFFAFAA